MSISFRNGNIWEDVETETHKCGLAAPQETLLLDKAPLISHLPRCRRKIGKPNYRYRMKDDTLCDLDAVPQGSGPDYFK